ncbi:Ldb19p NDAI_0A08610 [Naumovozyma dairenensis CBS 421]|uniref:LDB19 N-terminal domain-containing protein n=1 Tax=Naumovozyma dairenensis (strain ATCC 10597 / BCRC 20456 / CBS 421 / NBRC 0211 / NRRL Y-12639) TaxID=1071378 RepID=G0W5C6_NAUDC|nr:hypothetical protein NDAI_0A08610 [Naumovozyma dairenensis CBS 421]CCD23014.1 hypothetical protein NDAI_0A08610 [Naumovozyma dairenensis CBS 421]
MAFARLASSKSATASSRLKPIKSSDQHPIELAINIESPPCVLYGPATDSTGALLSGVLNLTIKDPYSNIAVPSYDSIRSTKSQNNVNTSPTKLRRKSTLGSTLSTTFSHLSLSTPTLTPSSSTANSNVNASNVPTTATSAILSTAASSSSIPNTKTIINGYTKISVTSVTLTLIQKIHYHKPFVPDSQQINTCMNCRTKITDMKNWNIQKTAQSKSVGTHTYPFSYLIPGSVPSTALLGSNSESQVKYELIAVVTYKDPRKKSSNTDNEKLLQLSMPIAVTRSITRGPDKNSLRVFPPTELTAAAVLPNVIYPKSTFPLEMKLDGVSSGTRRWRMRKLSWRIEETTRIRSHACEVHKHELAKLEKNVKEKELDKSNSANKKHNHQIKRYGDVGPQIRVALSSPENIPLHHRNFRNLPSSRPSAAAAAGNSTDIQPGIAGTTRNDTIATTPQGQLGDRDDQDEVAGDEFVHPSDDALRQEILQQQQRLREQQIQQEIQKNNSTLFTEEVRIIAKGDMKSGWKTDFENNGKIELVTDIDCMGLNSGVSNPITHVSTTKPYINPHKQQTVNVACDIQDPNSGVYVNHILAVEIVVAEETLQYSNGQPIKLDNNKTGDITSTLTTNVNADQRLAELSPMFANRNAPKTRPVERNELSPVNSTSTNNNENGNANNRSSSSTNDRSLKKSKSNTNANSVPSSKIVSVATGAARVLRMQFRLLVTERSGLGISWDEEVPPIYQDVRSNGPPTYDETVVRESPTTQQRSLYEGQLTENDDTDADNLGTDLVEFDTTDLTKPRMAHYNTNSSNSSDNNVLNTIKSPPLENVISLQGNVPIVRRNGQSTVLTPNTTRENFRIPNNNISNVLDTDRITQ